MLTPEDNLTAAKNMVARLEHEAAGRHAEFMLALVAGMHSPECLESTFSVDLGSGNGIWEFHATRLTDLERPSSPQGLGFERTGTDIPDPTPEERQAILDLAKENPLGLLHTITADREAIEAIDPGRVIPINWRPLPEGGE